MTTFAQLGANIEYWRRINRSASESVGFRKAASGLLRF
jgi:hypothetical protein